MFHGPIYSRYYLIPIYMKRLTSAHLDSMRYKVPVIEFLLGGMHGKRQPIASNIILAISLQVLRRLAPLALFNESCVIGKMRRTLFELLTVMHFSRTQYKERGFAEECNNRTIIKKSLPR